MKHSKPITTPSQQSELLHILQAAAEPAPAIDLANTAGLSGSHESKRRKVRDLIKKLRDNGHWIVATIQGGYWLTKDKYLWQQYNEHRSIDAKVILADISRRKQAQRDQPQGMLFDVTNLNAIAGGF